MRFENEFNWLFEKNAVLVRLDRPRELRLKSIHGRDENDRSEIDLKLIQWKFPFVIKNDTGSKYKYVKAMEALFPKKI